MKKRLIFILSISLLLTSCTQKQDDMSEVIKEKELLESNLETANKYIDKLEKELEEINNDTKEDDKTEKEEEAIEYSLDDFKGTWLINAPNKFGLYIDENVIMDVPEDIDLEVESWGFVLDYAIYEDKLIIQKNMAKIDGEILSDRIMLYDVYTIGMRNDLPFLKNSLNIKNGESLYLNSIDMPEDLAREVHYYDPFFYREYYGYDLDNSM